MRTIKFRAKRLDNQEWVEGDLSLNHCYGPHIVTEIHHVDGAEYNVTDFAIDPATVGQFTGLHDKDGKEIWEGDVLERDTTHQLFGSIKKITVEYVEQSARYHAMGTTFGNLCEAITDISGRNCAEVIGNIHDNPELLTK